MCCVSMATKHFYTCTKPLNLIVVNLDLIQVSPSSGCVLCLPFPNEFLRFWLWKRGSGFVGSHPNGAVPTASLEYRCCPCFLIITPMKYITLQIIYEHRCEDEQCVWNNMAQCCLPPAIHTERWDSKGHNVPKLSKPDLVQNRVVKIHQSKKGEDFGMIQAFLLAYRFYPHHRQSLFNESANCTPRNLWCNLIRFQWFIDDNRKGVMSGLS